MKTGRDVVIAALLGAEEYGFATAPLVVMGCIMMRVCHLDTCPVGIATQNPKLREKFAGQAEHVVNFFQFVAEEVRELMAAARLPHARRDDRPQRPARHEAGHRPLQGARASTSARSSTGPRSAPTSPSAASTSRTTASTRRSTRSSCRSAAPALERGETVEIDLPIRNVNRTVGTILGSELTRKYGAAGLPDDTIRIKFNGSAGQSFGAFVPAGDHADASRATPTTTSARASPAARSSSIPPKDATFVAEDNIIIGNVALYGATGGQAFFRGRGRRALLRPQQRRAWPSSRAPATTAAST